MKSVSYEMLRRIMADRIASRYHDAALKAVRSTSFTFYAGQMAP